MNYLIMKGISSSTIKGSQLCEKYSYFTNMLNEIRIYLLHQTLHVLLNHGILLALLNIGPKERIKK